jgi:hypothetical protein
LEYFGVFWGVLGMVIFCSFTRAYLFLVSRVCYQARSVREGLSHDRKEEGHRLWSTCTCPQSLCKFFMTLSFSPPSSLLLLLHFTPLCFNSCPFLFPRRELLFRAT